MDRLIVALSAKLKAMRYYGLCIWDQGGSHWVASALDANGKLCDPRSWDTYSNPSGALQSLGRILELPAEIITGAN